MRLGIDFGTTRTVVAAADRGNYPVVSFQFDSGEATQWYPSVVVMEGDAMHYGLDALARQAKPGSFSLRSLKRLLTQTGPQSEIRVGDRSLPALQLLTGYLDALARDLRERSNLSMSKGEDLEVFIAAPAHCNSNLRFLAMDAFRAAGFRVLGMVNEPSAAGIEYAHRFGQKSRSGRRENLIVYDLGGGTFDAAVITMKDRSHEVLSNEGILNLGGDDFDRILLEMALSQAGWKGNLLDHELFQLLEECREQKERLHPNTRKVSLEFSRFLEDLPDVSISTGAFYERCRPLVEQTLEALARAVAKGLGDVDEEVAALYLVGGSSDLPVVGRLLREKYGRRVKRSPYPHAAVAIGLAITADADSGYTLTERFTRYFGVWREAEEGRQVAFDPIFLKDTPLPRDPTARLLDSRVYRPAHNIACLRYLECSQLQNGQPGGEITPWDEVLFPLDPGLREAAELQRLEIHRSPGVESQVIREVYSCDPSGVIQVRIANQTAGYEKEYQLGKGESKG
jgi:molecular chaperone DnaK (HSP70)